MLRRGLILTLDAAFFSLEMTLDVLGWWHETNLEIVDLIRGRTSRRK